MASKEKQSEQSALSHWDPFAELRRWGPLGERWPRRLSELFESDFPSLREFRPAIDVHEHDKEYTVTVELPGAKRDDVTVELKDHVLTIRGEKKSEREEEKGEARYVERRYGSFSRAFSLPADAVADKIEAKFENGVLTLRIPRAEESKPRAIHIGQ